MIKGTDNMVDLKNRKFKDYYYCVNASNGEKTMSIIGEYADEDLNPIFFLIAPLAKTINIDPEYFDDAWDTEWENVYELFNLLEDQKRFIISNIF